MIVPSPKGKAEGTIIFLKCVYGIVAAVESFHHPELIYDRKGSMAFREKSGQDRARPYDRLLHLQAVECIF